MSSESKLHDPRPSQTKIVATVGPACGQTDAFVDLLRAGVDVFRVNMAHGSREEHQRRVDDIREASRTVGWPVAILVDLAGPKIRLGELPEGQLDCVAGATLRFVRVQDAADPSGLVTNYEPLVDELEAGDRVMLADGTVALLVEHVDDHGATCRVIQGGTIRSRQGVNLPGVKLSVPCLTPQDRDNAAWAARAGVDFIGLSFVRQADDVLQLKAILAAENAECQVIAKIEKPEALDNLDAIVDAADGIMVARGDLGVEIDIARVAVVQKQIIAACRRARKPVIVATQMLDSMHQSRLPTRAEVTDVANAILDGADACMLSGETAIGRYPRQVVEMMHRIALATESLARERSPEVGMDDRPGGRDEIMEATTYAAGRMAETLHARMIVVASASGETAVRISQNRHFVPTVGVSNSEATLRRMCLYWGIIPVSGTPTDGSDKLLDHVINWGRGVGCLVPGDRIVLVSGTGMSASRHNVIVVHHVEELIGP